MGPLLPRHRSRAARFLAAATVLASLLAGCSGAPADTSTTPEPTTTPPGPPAAIPVEIPDTAAGRATLWVLDQLAARSGPDATEAGEVFAQVFLDEIPAADIAGVFDQLRERGPFTPTGYAEGPVDGGTTAQSEVTGPGGDRYLLIVSADDAERIQGLFLQPAPDLPSIDSVEDVAAAIAEVAQEGSYLLARVEGFGAEAVCEAVASHEPEVLRPVGSVFKLYVLLAVVDAVADGELAWDDTLTLTDDLRSLPSGTLQNEPAGTEVSVRDAAGAMIAISDNTATDLLIDAVGRGAVEAAVVRSGHGAPEVLRPFLTTREMFQLAFGSATGRTTWTTATGPDPLGTDPEVSDRQRAVVEALPGGAISLDEALLTDPAWPLGLDWFATASDVCRAHVELAAVAGTAAGAPVREILSQNPGLPDLSGLDYVGFKGGSAPGEIAGSWYVEADGARYVFVLAVASPDAAAPGGSWLVSVADQTLALAIG